MASRMNLVGSKSWSDYLKSFLCCSNSEIHRFRFPCIRSLPSPGDARPLSDTARRLIVLHVPAGWFRVCWKESLLIWSRMSKRMEFLWPLSTTIVSTVWCSRAGSGRRRPRCLSTNSVPGTMMTFPYWRMKGCQAPTLCNKYNISPLSPMYKDLPILCRLISIRWRYESSLSMFWNELLIYLSLSGY